MEKFVELQKKSHKNLKLADHMVHVTYKVVKDPKLMLAILENLFLSFSNSMSSLLYHERIFKRVPAFNDNFDSKFIVFKQRCAKRYNIDERYLYLAVEIKNIIVAHKKSPVEFSRNDRFVICDTDYKMKTITLDQLKKYLIYIKQFIFEIDRILLKNEGIFKRS